MAHNNGMLPRKGKGKTSAKAEKNAAKFAAAVQAAPAIAADPQIDPAYTATPISQFVPHRPARPEKSEGGRKFKLVSEYQPAGDQPTAIKELVRASRPMSATRCCWVSPAAARPTPWRR